MFEISKQDWKLFRQKIGGWQLRYMEGLCQSYMELLTGERDAADKFWELDERIKKDKKSPGVIIDMRRSTALWNVVALINDGVITQDELKDFSEEFRGAVGYIVGSR